MDVGERLHHPRRPLRHLRPPIRREPRRAGRRNSSRSGCAATGWRACGRSPSTTPAGCAARPRWTSSPPWPASVRALALPYCPGGSTEAELRWAGDGEAADYLPRRVRRRGLARDDRDDGGGDHRTGGGPPPTAGTSTCGRWRRGRRPISTSIRIRGICPSPGASRGAARAPRRSPAWASPSRTASSCALLERGPVRLRLAVESSFPRCRAATSGPSCRPTRPAGWARRRWSPGGTTIATTSPPGPWTTGRER